MRWPCCLSVYLSTSVYPLSISSNFKAYEAYGPVTVTARSKAWTVFARSNAGIVGSNPTQGMDVLCVCMCLFCVCVVLCLGSGLATGWSLVQGALPAVKNDYGTD
jgi:hypothetical protein